MNMGLALIAVLLLGGPTMAEPQVLGLCDLWARPLEYRGTMVRVRGDVSLGLEAFTLRTPDCKDQLLLAMGGKASVRPASPSQGGRTTGPAAADASLQDFLAAGKGDLAAIPADRWLPILPVTSQKDALWNGFEAAALAEDKTRDGVPCIACPRYAVVATLEGYFDYAPGGRVQRDEQGALTFSSGFGHNNMFRGLLVVTRVVEFKATRTK